MHPENERRMKEVSESLMSEIAGLRDKLDGYNEVFNRASAVNEMWQSRLTDYIKAGDKVRAAYAEGAVDAVRYIITGTPPDTKSLLHSYDESAKMQSTEQKEVDNEYS
jgi:hypothetical protein